MSYIKQLEKKKALYESNLKAWLDLSTKFASEDVLWSTTLIAIEKKRFVLLQEIKQLECKIDLMMEVKDNKNLLYNFSKVDNKFFCPLKNNHIKEVLKCDTDDETKWDMIDAILHIDFSIDNTAMSNLDDVVDAIYDTVPEITGCDNFHIECGLDDLNKKMDKLIDLLTDKK